MLATAPLLDAAGRIVRDCWADLDSARYPGPVAPGPIPWPAIRDWCQFHGLDRQMTGVVVIAIGYCDAQRAERIASEIRMETKRAEARAKARR